MTTRKRSPSDTGIKAVDLATHEVRAALQILTLDVDIMAIGGLPETKLQEAIAQCDTAIDRLVAAVKAMEAEAAAAGLREAAKIISEKSDLIRGSRGSTKAACSELDMTARDLSERAASIEQAGRRPK